MGTRAIQPCWMRIPFRRRHNRYAKLPKEAVVVPALNELCGGVPVNDLRVNFLGPLFDPALLKTDDADIHLLDGTHLGKLRDLRSTPASDPRTTDSESVAYRDEKRS